MVRHSAVYVGGTALQGLGVLIILPFATRLLGPAEFGRVAAGLVVVQMFGTLASAGLPQVILREHNRGADGPRAARALAGAMILVAVLLGIIGALVVLGLGRGGLVVVRDVLPLVVGAAALTVVVSGQTLMRARLQPWSFLVLAVGSTVGAQGAGLIVARTSPTANTYLIAYAVVLALVAAVAVVLGRPLLPTAQTERVRAGVRLALPLVPQGFAMLGLLMGDVLLASSLLGPEAAGSYQVALQLGNMPFVLATALFSAWAPMVLSAPLESRWAFTARTGTVMTAVVAAGAVEVALLSPWLVMLMSKADFGHVAMVATTGWLVTTAIFYMIYLGSSLAVLDAERTSRIALASVLGLAVLGGLSLVLAPRLGITGIAIAKVAAYGVLAFATTSFATTQSPLRWPRWLLLAIPLPVVAAVALGGQLGMEGWGAVLRLVAAGLVLVVVVGRAPRVLRLLRD